MKVKTIFKVLIGTIAFMVIFMILVEMFNIGIYSWQLKKLVNVSIKQATEMYVQESYIANGNKNWANQAVEIGSPGGGAVKNGAFFSAGSERDTWREIYSSDQFADFVSKEGRWYYYMNMLYYAACRDSGKQTRNITVFSEINNKDVDYHETRGVMADAHYIIDYCLTAANLGVAYIDKGIIRDMIEYNVFNILTAAEKENDIQNKLYSKTDGRVKYNGFICQKHDIEVEVNYKTYYLGDNTTISNRINSNNKWKLYNAAKFKEDTDIGAGYNTSTEELESVDDPIFSYDAMGDGLVTFEKVFQFANNSEDKYYDLVDDTDIFSKQQILDSQLITVPTIKVKMKVAYQGVTPFGEILNYIMSRGDVEGYSNEGREQEQEQEQEESNQSDIENTYSTLITEYSYY